MTSFFKESARSYIQLEIKHINAHYPSKDVESSILEHKKTGQDISEAVTSNFLESSVIRDDKIVGWIKIDIKWQMDDKVIKSGVLSGWYYRLP